MTQFRFDAQVVDIEKVNPLFAKCKIQVCYDGLHRNNGIIPRNVIDENIGTLYNCPIVGEYSKEKEDFLDHGGKVERDNDGNLKYISTTIPYGVVPESSEIKWEFIDGKDYLTCTGYLWVDRYPEVLETLEGSSRPQSMEVYLEGEFNDQKQFVASKLTFSGLCILGKDVEPCYEGANVQLYTLNKDEFSHEFNLMIRELKASLKESQSGGDNQDVNKPLDFTNINEINKNDEEDETVTVKSKQEIAAQFSLTTNQLYEEINRALCQLTYKAIDWWTGDEVDKARYCMCDFDENFVYVQDKTSGWMDVKLSYSMDGDNVVIDFESAKRIKYVATDWDEGTAEDEVIATFTKKLVDEIEAEVVQKVSEFKSQISQKEEDVISVGQKMHEIETKFSAQETVIAEKETKIAELSAEIQTFKKHEDDEQVEGLLKEFTLLMTEDEKTGWREKRGQFGKFEDFKKEIKSFMYDRVINKSKESNSSFITMALVDNQEPEDKANQSQNIWDRLRNKNK